MTTGPPIGIKIRLLRDVLWNMLTGYVEPPRATNNERTTERQRNEIDACHRLMTTLVGPGDLFDSTTRTDIVKEAYGCYNNCTACQSMTSVCLNPKKTDFATMNQTEIPHEYSTTDGPFRDVIHAIANMQDKLDEPFFHRVVERMKEYDATTRDGSSSSKNNNEEEDDDKYKAMAIELCVIVACCCGVKAFYKAAGLEPPPLPNPPVPPLPAKFRTVSDYSNVPLATDVSIAWGPYIPSGQLRTDVADRYDFDMQTFAFAGHSAGPTSKASSAPTTCMEWLRFMDVMYTPSNDAPRFFSVPGNDRYLTRGQLETVAEGYTEAVSCRF